MGHLLQGLAPLGLGVQYFDVMSNINSNQNQSDQANKDNSPKYLLMI